MEQKILFLYDERRYSFSMVSNIFLHHLLEHLRAAPEVFVQRRELDMGQARAEFNLSGIGVQCQRMSPEEMQRFAQNQSLGLEQLSENLYYLRDLGEGKYGAMP